MVEIKRGQYGYYVECDSCGAVLEITHEDAEDGVIECENCGHFDRIGETDATDEDESEEDVE